jgi:hypothetical protein
MGIQEILSSIDREIALLQRARTMLAGIASGRTEAAPRPARGAAKAKKTTRKRQLTPEGRRRIAEAVKRRWAAHRKAAAGK